VVAGLLCRRTDLGFDSYLKQAGIFQLDNSKNRHCKDEWEEIGCFGKIDEEGEAVSA